MTLNEILTEANKQLENENEELKERVECLETLVEEKDEAGKR